MEERADIGADFGFERTAAVRPMPPFTRLEIYALTGALPGQFAASARSLSVDEGCIGLNGWITCGQTHKFPVGAARTEKSADIGADFKSACDAGLSRGA
jgi:hypothetical protein